MPGRAVVGPHPHAIASRYAALWRWHFYAGLFTAPFLLILSVTGAIYLFNDELNDLIYPELRFASSSAAALPTSSLIDAATQRWPGSTVTRVDMPTAEGRSAMLFVNPAEGEPFRAFVDPGTADVLGTFIYARTLVGFADVFHGSLMLGDVGDAIVELAACWALVLIVTGLYLWWPRGQRVGGRLLPRLTLRGRRLWREVHRFIGFYSAALILFLILSGLPWATVWGGMVLQPVSNALGLGYPQTLRHHNSNTPTMADTLGEAPWTLEQAPLPAPAHTAMLHPAERHDIGVDNVAAILARQGMAPAYRLSLPSDEQHLYSAYTYPDRPEGQHTVHVDRFTGEVLADIRFEDYGAVAKLVEWGVAIHMGNYWGRANQLVMLLTCIAIVALVITGVVMWWRRRPPGGLGAPRASKAPQPRTIMLITVALLMVFPLTGLSLLAVFGLDALWRRAACRRRS